MGNVCIENNSSRKLGSAFGFSHTSWVQEGFFSQETLDVDMESYLELQGRLSLHWKKIPKNSKSFSYLIQK